MIDGSSEEVVLKTLSSKRKVVDKVITDNSGIPVDTTSPDPPTCNDRPGLSVPRKYEVF